MTASTLLDPHERQDEAQDDIGLMPQAPARQLLVVFDDLRAEAAPEYHTYLEGKRLSFGAPQAISAELFSFAAFEERFVEWSDPLITYFKEERGAPSVKVAASLALKMIGQEIIARPVASYLASGRAPRVEELRFYPKTELPYIGMCYAPTLLEEELYVEVAPGPSEQMQLSLTIDRLLSVLHIVLGRRKVPPSVFYSNTAMAYLSPLFSLRQHGVHPQKVAQAMTLLLATAGKRLSGGIVWRGRELEGQEEIAPRRKACCLKYVLPTKPHLCTTCSRRDDTPFFDPVLLENVHGHK
ncbi:hypothetical protein [Polycladidibacter hongkongensis]|uniref:hypothetical protein n=1 Tax=Polycladidibacter hongkongensis TaxID=1647556 RepID=UPI00082CD1B4|nr:hypothetical protein [Pseudovibrio hongkongensis]